VINVLVQVQNITVKQILLSVPATVINVLVQIQNITVHQMLSFVLAIVMPVLRFQQQNITVQQAMLFVLTTLPLVTVQAVTQYLIVSHVLPRPPVTPTYALIMLAIIVVILLKEVLELIAPPHTTGVTAQVLARHLRARCAK